MNDIRLLYIDLFCGAGGTSTGVEKANYKGRKCAKVIACVNHDANAIASHAANHPEAQHYTEDRFSVVKPEFIANNYSGGGQLSSLDNPCPAVMTNPKQNVIACKWYLMNPQFSNAGGSVEKPCFTLIAKMDKKPPYLIATECGQLAIEIYETDSGPMRKIKEFMALYGIVDIKMRMLKIIELKRIMGFPENYTLIGTQADQKKFIGNAVEVNIARVLCEALVEEIVDELLKVA